jgi:transcription initiation factor TFIIB
VVCSVCGLVNYEVHPSLRQEWRSFTHREYENKTRGTVLRNRGTSFNPKETADPEDTFYFHKLSKINNRYFQETEDRNLSIADTIADELILKLGLNNSIKNEVMKVYRTALSKDLVRGRSIDSFIAASIYLVIREKDLPVSITKISEVCTRDRRDIFLSYRLIIQNTDYKSPKTNYAKFIPVGIRNLGLNMEVQNKAVSLLREAEEKRIIAGKDPRGLAAAVLYLVCKEDIKGVTQKAAAQSTGTTEVTLRNRMQDIVEGLNLTL